MADKLADLCHMEADVARREGPIRAPSPHEDFAVSTRLLGEVLEASPANRSCRARLDRLVKGPLIVRKVVHENPGYLL